MVKYKGKGVNKSIAIGKISVLKKQEFISRPINIGDATTEIVRFEEAKSISIRQLEDVYKKAYEELGEKDAQIFSVHIMILQDTEYDTSVKKIITDKQVNAEYAVKMTADKFEEKLNERAADIRDVSSRLIANLKSVNMQEANIQEKVVICAEELLPSQVVWLDKNKISAFVSIQGSANSHAAIIARNMNIPMIVGMEEEFFNDIEEGTLSIIDGYTGEVIINPDEETIENYRKKQLKDNEKKKLLHELRGKESITIDGRKIKICANIESSEHIEDALENDAEGIGLFRSEFIYLKNNDYPTEEQQFEEYKKVLQSMTGKTVIIRTLDIGTDKKADYFEMENEENPALGYRGIRISLERQDVFKTQLRALYRASMYGRLGIMFPMITSVFEVLKIKEICEEVKNELTKENVEYSEEVKLGIMIETPAAALISDELAPLVDFFSIGTNDLIQYTLACDRQNSKLENFCNNHHKAVLKLIDISTKNAHKTGIWVGICGELAADTALIEIFLKMGIDELSVAPGNVLSLRKHIREMDLRGGIL